MKQPSKQPRVYVGDLKTIVNFFKYKPNDGPEPGEVEEVKLFTCYAKVDEVWAKDLEQAKTNGTLSDITVTVRDTLGEYIPETSHYLEIDLPYYVDKRFNIKHVQPDPQKRDFIKVIAGLAVD